MWSMTSLNTVELPPDNLLNSKSPVGLTHKLGLLIGDRADVLFLEDAGSEP